MARYNPHHDAAPIFAAAARWRDQCLLTDGSVFFPGERIWTAENLAHVRAAFSDNPDQGSDTFLTKLKRQLNGQPDGVKHLAAELLWAMLLFPSNTGADRKRETISEILSWRSTQTPPDSELLSDQVLGGLGSTGTAYNTHRPREFAYLIDIATQLKGLDEIERRRVLSEPWALSDFLSKIAVSGTRQLSHIIQHLLFPDTFERISSGDDKRRVIVAFSNENPGVVKQMDRATRDRRLFDIREAIAQPRGNANFDFYEDEFAQKWRVEGPSDAAADETITQADIRLLVSARRHARYQQLDPDELSNYRHIHRVLDRLGQIVVRRLGGPEDYELRLTSGFTPTSGVRGAIPKDLWFGVFRRENREGFVGNPQLFMIVSGRGVELGFAAATHPSDFSNTDIKARLREAAPRIYSLLPAPASSEARSVGQALNGEWLFRRKSRLDPGHSDFPDFDSWLQHFKVSSGRTEGGGCIARYLTGSALDEADLAADVATMADTFKGMLDTIRETSEGQGSTTITIPPRTTKLFAELFAKALGEFSEARKTPLREVPELWDTMDTIKGELANLPSVQSRPHILVNGAALGSPRSAARVRYPGRGPRKTASASGDPRGPHAALGGAPGSSAQKTLERHFPVPAFRPPVGGAESRLGSSRCGRAQFAAARHS
jgi:hypothetical protein